MKSIFLQFFIGLAALLCCEITWAGNTAAATSANETDGLVTSLDYLFKRTDVHRAVVYPEQPDLLQITRADFDVNKGSILSAEWCGSRLLRFYYGHYDYDEGEKVPPDHGQYLADVQSHKIWRLRKFSGGGEIVNCSPDGQWLIYKRSSHGAEVILGRYNITSGTKEDFVRFKDPFSTSLGEWSPDGTKILFYGKVDLVGVKTSKPVWNIFWIKRELSLNGLEAKWLGDSSGVLLHYQSDPKNNRSKFVLAIDRSGDPAKPLEVLDNVPPEFRLAMIDSANHIYGVVDIREPVRTGTYLRRCVSVKKNLECESIIPGDPQVSLKPLISPDGKSIYYSPYGSSDRADKKDRGGLWRYDLARNEKTCVLPDSETPLGISPDGHNLAISTLGESLAVVHIGTGDSPLRPAKTTCQ
jgi:hypothetical protein